MSRAFMIVVAASLLTACGSKEKTFEVADGKGEKTTVAIKGEGERVTVRSGEGELVMQQGGQGAVFPVHAPQYPGSTIVSSTRFANPDGQTGSTLVQTTDASVGDVVAFYKQKIPQGGLQVLMEQSAGQSALLVAGREGDEESGSVINVNGDGAGTTTIAIMSSAAAGG